jgi:catechol 2,3-dioxygenase-like lactoylglutathione lyase family enzyme
VFEDVVIRCSDRVASEAFYETMLAALGIRPTPTRGTATRWADLALDDAHRLDGPTTGLHVGLVARTREDVDRWWELGRAAGYADAGAPGPRPQYRDDYYGAFLLDPDGNSIEAVHHGALRSGGIVDHVWLRVDDLDRARTFARIVAAQAGVVARDVDVEGGGVQVVATEGGGSFTFVRGTPTEHARLVLPASRHGLVSFHRALVEAGFEEGDPVGSSVALTVASESMSLR